MSLVRIASFYGERGQSLSPADRVGEPQKALKTHNPFKPLWSVPDGRNKAPAQVPTADAGHPGRRGAAPAQCNPPLNFQDSEADHRVGPRRIAPQGRCLERGDDLCVTARVFQLLLEQPYRIAGPQIAQRHTAIHQPGNGCTERLGRDSRPEPNSGEPGPGWDPRGPGRGVGTGDPWLQAGRPDDIDAAIGKHGAGLFLGGGDPDTRNPVA